MMDCQRANAEWLAQLGLAQGLPADQLGRHQPRARAKRAGGRQLRALGVVTPEMTRTTIGIADVQVEVGLQLVRFRNGNSWSFFLCPHCGRRARTLKLFEGSVLCWRCCHRRGARYRVWTVGLRGRAEGRIPKLRAMLESPESLRLKPHLWGTMERRKRLEAALRRCEFIVARHQLADSSRLDKGGK